jgi:ethanolamine ammonia-lyase large subunit
MVAAVAKLMSNLDLIYAAKKIRITAHCNTTIGEAGILAFRLQPNHTTDDLDGIRISLFEGLSYGAGDAVLGLNPVNDTVNSVSAVLRMFEEIKQRYAIPTQTCVLAHVTTQMEAIRKGAPADLIFQSIAGSEMGNRAFGISGALITEAQDLALRQGTATGPNVMYFETGQGSELSSDAHHDADQLTMEARCYGFARNYQPFLVNSVVGFIGPEYLYDSTQVIRAGLEDHFMGKLSGLPMGVDACYTNHVKADQNDIENLAVLLSCAGCNYFMSVPQGDDIMLNYQCTGYHEAPSLRELLGLKPIREFELWLERMGIYENGRLSRRAGDASLFLG